MNLIVQIGLRFIFLLLLQVLVLNQIELGFGIQIMIYPLFIVLLPVDTGVFALMGAAFVMGLIIDAMSNTFGLHTSSLLLVAYARPMVFKLFAPRDGYDTLVEINLFTMGTSWFVRVYGLLLLLHHFWFFMLEMFKLNELLFVFQKTLLSVPISFAIALILQYLFIRNRAEK